MKKKALLHIGSNKTGTTSIQSAFYRNKQKLEKQGFTYPGDEFCHHKFYFTTKQEESCWPRQFKGIPYDQLQDMITQYLLSVANDLQKDIPFHIISSEYLFRSDADAVRNVVEFLSDFVDEIEVYAFVRAPVPYYNSRQQQIIKASHQIISPKCFRYEFKAVLETWVKHAKVNVIDYDKDADSLSRLAEAMGVDISHFKTSQKKNESLSIEQMLLLEKIQRNVYSDQDDTFKHHLGLIHQIKTDQETKPTLKNGVAEIIEENHEQDLVWLKEEYVIDLFDKPKARPKKNKRKVGSDLRLPPQPRIRDVYSFDERKAEKYESMVLDFLVKKFIELNKT